MIEQTRYVAYVRALDRPGALTSIAEVVSGRGVSVESFVSGERRDQTTLLTLVFSTSARLRTVIERALRRLAVVSSVLVVTADSPQVRAAGVVHAARGHRFVPPPETAVTWSGDTSAGEPLLVEGTLSDVEAVLAAARAAGAVRVSSVLLPP